MELPSADPERLASHVGALTDALDTERRLLEELIRVLLAQREGISSDDLDALDESVFAAHRIFRTLTEARQRRRTLLQLVGAPEDLRVTDLESTLGDLVTPELKASCGALLESAAMLARELRVNRHVIDGAMAVGQSLLEIFTGTGQEPTTYAEGAEPKKGGGPGAILNTRV